MNKNSFLWANMPQKSFLISSTPADAPPECRIRLDNGMYFIWQKNLSVTRIVGQKTGREAILIGIAIQQDSTLPSPEKILQEEELDCEKCISSWGGRWFLYKDNNFYNDFFTACGVFYSADAVSNCFSVLRSHTGAVCPDPRNFVRYGHGVDYIPGPETLLPNVKKLLPMQRLVRKNGFFMAEFHPLKPLFTDAAPGEVIDFAVDRVGTFLKACEKKYDTLWLPLSGGYDSRTVLAIALHAGVNLKAYTCIKPAIALPDNRYPDKICAEHGIEHLRLYRKKERTDLPISRAKRFDEHTSSLCVERDREYFIYHQIPPDEGRSVAIGSVVWDTLHNLYMDKFPPDLDVNLPAEQVFSNFPETAPQVLRLLEKYLEHVRANPLDNIPFFRRFYYEQRVGCWSSGIDNAWDMYPVDRLQPANSEHMAACILRLSELFPQAYTGQTALLKRIAPHLLRLPFNTPQYSPIYRSCKKILNNVRYLWCEDMYSHKCLSGLLHRSKCR